MKTKSYSDILSDVIAERIKDISIDRADLTDSIQELIDSDYKGVITVDAEGTTYFRRSEGAFDDEVTIIGEGVITKDGDASDWADSILENRPLENPEPLEALSEILKNDKGVKADANETFWSSVGLEFARIAEGTPAEDADFPTFEIGGEDDDSIADTAKKGLEIVLERLAEEAKNTDTLDTAFEAIKKAIFTTNNAHIITVYWDDEIGLNIGDNYNADGKGRGLVEIRDEYSSLSDLVANWDEESKKLWARALGLKYDGNEDESFSDFIQNAGKEDELKLEWLESGGVETECVIDLAETIDIALQDAEIEITTNA